MKSIIYGALAALSVTAASAVEVDTNSANYLLPHCKAILDDAPFENFQQGVWMGTVYGVARALATTLMIVKTAAERGVRFSPPIPAMCADIPLGKATHTQMIRIVVAYIEARPNQMHEDFAALAALALMDAWPCKK